MLFQKRIDRAFQWLKEKNGKQGQQASEGSDKLPSMEELKAQAQEEMDLEKGDFLAMLIAGFAVILPAGIIVLLLMVGFMFFF